MDIAAFGLEPYTQAEYLELVDRTVADAVPPVSAERRRWLSERLSYRQADVTDVSGVVPHLTEAFAASDVLCYLALPPSRYPHAVRAMAAVSLPPSMNLIVEKPFGVDIAAAELLRNALAELLPEQRVFRADHFLHHQMIHNAMALRRGNSFLEAAWNREHIESVEIVWEESAVVRGYIEFFDELGSVRDMVQSHLLMLLAMVGMDLPAPGSDLPSARLDALRAVRTPSPQDAADLVVRSRYTAGRVHGDEVRDYSDEPGVDPDRATETHVSVQLELDVERWGGVPFVLRTGKAIGSPRRHIDVRWRRPEPSRDSPGSLRVEAGPDRINLTLGVAGANTDHAPQPVDLVTAAPSPDMPPTARMLRDVLAGRAALFPSQPEVDECWRIAEAILDACAAGGSPLLEYQAGTHAPTTGF